MKLKGLHLIILVIFTVNLYAQDDQVGSENPAIVSFSDNAEPYTPANFDSLIDSNSPRKALLYSAIMPGLGQAYNKKYWKMPIVYGGFIGFGYVINFYNQQYVYLKNDLFKRLYDPTYISTISLSKEQLRSIVDQARRERDYMIILTTAFYFLQIADAHIDAHLYEFDINPELQVKLEPSFETVPGQTVFGFGLALKF